MKFSLFPKSYKFNDLFIQQNRHILKASKLLNEIFTKSEEIQHKVKEIQLIEAEGNGISREITRQLSLTFITPLDREDIHEINVAQEALLNVIKTIANRVGLHDSTTFTKHSKELISNFNFMIEEIHNVLEFALHKQDASESVRRVKTLKELSDVELLQALTEIYQIDLTRPDAIKDVVTWTQIYDRIEKAMLRAENLANMLEGISLKYA
ncbi:MAG TPA: DUF47 family protein [Candidatus Cloacimonadota bacterium]|nr:DUF47 family protein [Candidatus Cloacimonadota bacterium]HPT72730.1 DUF47 family protein [Candidatus Cloacimonadota bacterium]